MQSQLKCCWVEIFGVSMLLGAVKRINSLLIYPDSLLNADASALVVTTIRVDAIVEFTGFTSDLLEESMVGQESLGLFHHLIVILALFPTVKDIYYDLGQGKLDISLARLSIWKGSFAQEMSCCYSLRDSA